jgi:chaperone modulatory protein CbpM
MRAPILDAEGAAVSDIERVLEGQMLDESSWLELREFCACLRVEPGWVGQLVAAGVLEPRGPSPEAWSFPASALARVRVTVRLVEGLGVNLAGAAVILDLTEQRRGLERRLCQLEQWPGVEDR